MYTQRKHRPTPQTHSPTQATSTNTHTHNTPVAARGGAVAGRREERSLSSPGLFERRGGGGEGGGRGRGRSRSRGGRDGALEEVWKTFGDVRHADGVPAVAPGTGVPPPRQTKSVSALRRGKSQVAHLQQPLVYTYISAGVGWGGMGWGRGRVGGMGWGGRRVDAMSLRCFCAQSDLFVVPALVVERTANSNKGWSVSPRALSLSVLSFFFFYPLTDW